MSRFMLDTNVLSDIGNERAGWQRIVGKIALYGQHRCVLSATTSMPPCARHRSGKG